MRDKYPTLRTLARAVAVAAVAVVAGLVPATTHAQPLDSQPGYVDFQRFGAFSDEDLKVEINLGGALLKMLAVSLEDEEAEFAKVLQELRGLRVNIFKMPQGKEEATQKRIRDTINSLSRQGWEVVVRIKDESDLNLLLLSDGDSIAGLLAVFAEPGETVGFVNIVGNFDPAQIARLGKQFNLPPLSELGKETQR